MTSKAFRSISMAFLLLASFNFIHCAESEENAPRLNPKEERVAPPRISPASGSVVEQATIEMSAVEGAEIIFTLDGSDPNPDSPGALAYTAPIVERNIGTAPIQIKVKARALKKDMLPSLIVAASITIEPLPSDQVAAPTIDPNGGEFTGQKVVTLATRTPQALIRFTRGDEPSAPTKESELYGGPITVTKSETIRAIAFKEGMRKSGETSASFIINPTPVDTVKAPIFTLDPGDDDEDGIFTIAQELTMTSETEDADIFYTENDTAPTKGSKPYTGPLTFDSPVVIRAKAFKEGMNPSEETTQTLVFNIVNPSLDADGDGLTILEESAAGTSDGNVDSDGDGFSDYAEVKDPFRYGTNPTAERDSIFEGTSRNFITSPMLIDSMPGFEVGGPSMVSPSFVYEGEHLNAESIKVGVKRTMGCDASLDHCSSFARLNLKVYGGWLETHSEAPRLDIGSCDFSHLEIGESGSCLITLSGALVGFSAPLALSLYGVSLRADMETDNYGSGSFNTKRPAQLEIHEVEISYGRYLGGSPVSHEDNDGDSFSFLDGDCMDSTLGRELTRFTFPGNSTDPAPTAEDPNHGNGRDSNCSPEPQTCTIDFSTKGEGVSDYKVTLSMVPGINHLTLRATGGITNGVCRRTWAEDYPGDFRIPSMMPYSCMKQTAKDENYGFKVEIPTEGTAILTAGEVVDANGDGTFAYDEFSCRVGE